MAAGGLDIGLAPSSCKAKAALHKCLQEGRVLCDGLPCPSLCRVEKRESSKVVLWAADLEQCWAVATQAAFWRQGTSSRASHSSALSCTAEQRR